MLWLYYQEKWLKVMKGTPTRSGINLGWYEQKYHLKIYFLKIVRYHELQFNDSELIEPLFIHELKKTFIWVLWFMLP